MLLGTVVPKDTIARQQRRAPAAASSTASSTAPLAAASLEFMILRISES